MPRRRSTREAHFEQVYVTNAADLLSYFGRRVRIPADAADLLSETFVVAWRRGDRMPADPEQARMWLFGVARRVLANAARGSAESTSRSSCADTSKRCRPSIPIRSPSTSAPRSTRSRPINRTRPPDLVGRIHPPRSSRDSRDTRVVRARPLPARPSPASRAPSRAPIRGEHAISARPIDPASRR